ncbi:avidin/streptavidin family protein [Reyranella sp.]|uniref:avidin/streptavidin family protein n=1 Tax=Reyranella sp. TaxID=1929291 RepID=UPI003D0989A5
MSQRLASILGLSLAALGLVPQQAAAQSPSVTGTWANDHGSVLVIRSVGTDGSVAGTYANNAPGYKCGGIAFPIVGWMDGPRISYTVRWKNASVDCTSITSWTGYFNDGRLGVEWVLTYEEQDGSKVRIGSDSYRRK